MLSWQCCSRVVGAHTGTRWSSGWLLLCVVVEEQAGVAGDQMQGQA